MSNYLQFLTQILQIFDPFYAIIAVLPENNENFVIS